MNRSVRGISWLLAVVLALDGVLGALAHSHACPNHNHATVSSASHDDPEHGCDHSADLANSSDSTPAPVSPNSPDEGCAACRYLAQSGVVEFTPSIGLVTDRVARFVPPVVKPIESSFLRVHFSRGPPAAC